MRSSRAIITLKNKKSPVSEAYRTLMTNLEFSNLDGGLKTIIVTSTEPGEGKSTTLTNLAIAMAEQDKRIALIDADMRKSVIHRMFGIPNMKGLTNILLEGIDYKEVTNTIQGLDNLDIITSGTKPPNPVEILGSQRMKDFLEMLESEYDMILIDVPPILPVADASVVASYVDGVVLVIGYGQISVEAAAQAKEQLEKVNAKTLGVVLNKVPVDQKDYYYYYYYYDKETGSKKKKRR
ncbi:MAG: CpsD/CapB family tyrosine-protein kinase, partial [Clostridia bacterium]|nr:CpsD/CapB family tyrosine-protein kinase [Clostridia bacterium]